MKKSLEWMFPYTQEECNLFHKFLEMNNQEQFMLESNRIEGEDRLNPNDIGALRLALDGIHKFDDILAIHALLGKYLNKDWVGRLRTCQVYIGKHIPPHHKDLRTLMFKYVMELPEMDSWKAHNEFEKIHPFQDLNGRLGRLIWLSKAIKEGYNYSLPFLQKYYYQTLNQYK